MRSSISEIIGNSGCKLFLQALTDRRIVSYVDALIKETKKNIVIFCPIDSAFKKIYRTKTPAATEKEILLNHVAFKHDSHGTMFETLNGGKIILNPVESEGKVVYI